LNFAAVNLMDGSKFGIRGVGYVLCLVIPDFLQNVITSINGPLYPPEAAQRGLNDGTYGLVLSFFRGVLIVFVILIGTQVTGTQLDMPLLILHRIQFNHFHSPGGEIRVKTNFCV